MISFFWVPAIACGCYVTVQQFKLAFVNENLIIHINAQWRTRQCGEDFLSCSATFKRKLNKIFNNLIMGPVYPHYNHKKYDIFSQFSLRFSFIWRILEAWQRKPTQTKQQNQFIIISHFQCIRCAAVVISRSFIRFHYICCEFS